MRNALSVTALLLSVPVAALAQSRSAPDPLAECERFALSQSKSDGGSLKSIRIERGDSLIENRFDKKVGSQYVSIEYIAFAAIEDAQGKRRGRIVCLHTGTPGNKAVYLVEIPK